MVFKDLIVYCYHICQFDTGGHTEKARPVEVLTCSQGNLEPKGETRKMIKIHKIVIKMLQSIKQHYKNQQHYTVVCLPLEFK